MVIYLLTQLYNFLMKIENKIPETKIMGDFSPSNFQTFYNAVISLLQLRKRIRRKSILIAFIILDHILRLF